MSLNCEGELMVPKTELCYLQSDFYISFVYPAKKNSLTLKMYFFKHELAVNIFQVAKKEWIGYNVGTIMQSHKDTFTLCI